MAMPGIAKNLAKKAIEIFETIFKFAYGNNGCFGNPETVGCSSSKILEVAAKFMLLFDPNETEQIRDRVLDILKEHKCAPKFAIVRTWATLCDKETRRKIIRELIEDQRALEDIHVPRMRQIVRATNTYLSVTRMMWDIEDSFDAVRAILYMKDIMQFLKNCICGTALVLPTVLALDGICVIAGRIREEFDMIDEAVRICWCLSHHYDTVISITAGFSASYLYSLIFQNQVGKIKLVPFWIPAVHAQARCMYNIFSEGCNLPDWCWIPEHKYSGALDLEKWKRDPFLRLGDADFSNTHFEIPESGAFQLFVGIHPEGFEKETAIGLILASNEYNPFDARKYLMELIYSGKGRELVKWLYSDFIEKIGNSKLAGSRYLKDAASLLLLVALDGGCRFENEEMELLRKLETKWTRAEFAGLQAVLAVMNEQELNVCQSNEIEIISFKNEISCDIDLSPECA